MEQPVELTESPYAAWVSGLIIAAASLGALTVFMGLFEGTVSRALFFGVAGLAAAVAARTMAQVIRTHTAAATVVLVFSLIAFGSGLQSAILGTGQ
ncbi:MAG TPA: hypothetical protein VGA30_03975 [Actinomycetota bacterium]